VTQDIALALEEQLDDVAKDQVDEQQEKNDIQVDEDKEEDIAHERQFGVEFEEPSFQEAEKEDDHTDQGHPEAFALPSPLSEKIFGKIHGIAGSQGENGILCQSVSKSHMDTKKKI